MKRVSDDKEPTEKQLADARLEALNAMVEWRR
jgi:hypothetical protein